MVCLRRPYHLKFLEGYLLHTNISWYFLEYLDPFTIYSEIVNTELLDSDISFTWYKMWEEICLFNLFILHLLWLEVGIHYVLLSLYLVRCKNTLSRRYTALKSQERIKTSQRKNANPGLWNMQVRCFLLFFYFCFCFCFLLLLLLIVFLFFCCYCCYCFVVVFSHFLLVLEVLFQITILTC